MARVLTYDGTDLVAEHDPYGVVQRRYVHGPSDDDPLVWYEGPGTADRRWLHADERGSITAISNSANSVVAINAYDEYSILTSTNQGRFQYTGQTWLPEVGLYYYKARVYSPTLGRFLQTDPTGYDDGINWYDYVSGDPVNAVDPSGLFGETCSASGLGCGPSGIKDSRSWTGFAAGNGKEPIPQSVPKQIPNGPYSESKGAAEKGRFDGPAMPKGQGPRATAQWVPIAKDGGPAGSTGYWKHKGPGQQNSKGGWKHFNRQGRSITAAQAHPNPRPTTMPSKSVAVGVGSRIALGAAGAAVAVVAAVVWFLTPTPAY